MALPFNFEKTKFIITKKFRKKMRDLGEVGDWYLKNGTLYIVAYDTGDEIVNQALLLHEFIEAALMMAFMFVWKVPQYRADMVDLASPTPLNQFHQLAEEIEKEFIKAIGRRWELYCDFLAGIVPEYKKVDLQKTDDGKQKYKTRYRNRKTIRKNKEFRKKV